MAEQLDVRKLVNEATQGVIADELDPLVVPDLALGIMPRLIEAAVAKSSDPDEIESLKVVQSLIRERAIAVATDAYEHAVRGLGKDISLHKHRVPERRGFSLVLVVNPTVAYSIGSGDDSALAVDRVKEVMIEAYMAYGDLLQKGEFIPNHEV